MENKIDNSIGNKPRYDGGGTEFGLIHRELPRGCGMFDLDRVSARAEMHLELRAANVGFIEYRTDFNTATYTYPALFEVKHKHSATVEKCLSMTPGQATAAQHYMSKLLGARFFLVVATNGQQPFTFYELTTGKPHKIGVLNYFDRDVDGKDAINTFWKDVLKLI